MTLPTNLGMPGRKLLALSVGVGFSLLALSASVIAQQPLSGTFTNIDPPGAAVAAAWGINNDAVIVGRYKTTAAGVYKAFLRDENGMYRNINPPNAIWAEEGAYSSFGSPGHKNTWAIRINEAGQVVGCDHDTDLMGTMHGFLEKKGVFTDLALAASMNNGISSDGKTIVGFYTDMVTFASHAYILSSGSFMPFDVPGATLTNAWDINARGDIVGV